MARFDIVNIGSTVGAHVRHPGLGAYAASKAAAVLWLASAEAGFAVGHDLVVDGGATA